MQKSFANSEDSSPQIHQHGVLHGASCILLNAFNLLIRSHVQAKITRLEVKTLIVSLQKMIFQVLKKVLKIKRYYK